MRWSEHAALGRALADPARPPILLYPGEGAKDILREPPAGPVTLVVVDGTWSQAKNVVRDNPVLQALPRYAFVAPEPSHYRIRKEPSDEYVSTIEAVMHVLGALEGDPARFRALLDPFHAMVDAQLAWQVRTPRARWRKPRPPGVNRPRVPDELGTRWDDLVCVVGEANAWPYLDGAPQFPDELVHWVAERVATGERFDVVAAPAQPLSPSTSFHIGLDGAGAAGRRQPRRAPRRLRGLCPVFGHPVRLGPPQRRPPRRGRRHGAGGLDGRPRLGPALHQQQAGQPRELRRDLRGARRRPGARPPPPRLPGAGDARLARVGILTPMSLRLGGLADLDPPAVPLPAGTEITTRVDRAHGDRVVGQGAVGRVVAIDGDEVDVEVVDVGRVRYLRSEVVPRKLGVVRYAHRRHDAWDQLSPTVVIDTVVGSRAWGVADEGSDEDHRGVFVLPFAWTNGLVDPPLDLHSLDGSSAYWEIGKAIRQALRADPNTLEMLFAAAERRRSASARAPRDPRRASCRRRSTAAFGRYALSQLDRLEHNQRLAEHRVTDHRLAARRSRPRARRGWRSGSPTRRGSRPHRADARRSRARLHQAALPLDVRSGRDRRRTTGRRCRVAPRAAELELPRDLRPKNAYNLIRLLDLAIRWLAGEPPEVRVARRRCARRCSRSSAARCR